MPSITTSILDSIEILTDKKIATADFNNTIQGTVIACTNETNGEYSVRYGDSKILAYSNNVNIRYKKDAYVYILVPHNDITQTKFIVGCTDNRYIENRLETVPNQIHKLTEQVETIIGGLGGNPGTGDDKPPYTPPTVDLSDLYHKIAALTVALNAAQQKISQLEANQVDILENFVYTKTEES